MKSKYIEEQAPASTSGNEDEIKRLETKLLGEWTTQANELFEFNEDKAFSWYLSASDKTDNIQAGKYSVVELYNYGGEQVGYSIILDVDSLTIGGTKSDISIPTEMAILDEQDTTLEIKNLATTNTYTLTKKN